MSDDRRYYGLDALRGSMMLLGIVLHGATFYIAAPPPHLPLPSDPNKSLAMDAIFDFIHAFRMPCFFVLAGFFAALLVEKRGVAGALRNRVDRILLPLVAGLFTILPLTLIGLVDLTLAVEKGIRVLVPTLEQLRQLKQENMAKGIPGGLALLHLWFLLYLCYFSLLIPVCRALVRWSLPMEARITRALGSPWALAVLALVTATTLWPYPGAQVFGEFIFLDFDPVGFCYYGFFYVVGYVYHHYRAATANLVRYIPWCAALAAMFFPLSMAASHLEYSQSAFDAGYHAFAVVTHAICTWALIWLFVGVALRFFDKPTPWALYASQSAYWVYLLHMPVICYVCWLLVPVDVHAIAKFIVVVTVTTVVCFTTYHYWVQDGWIGAFLNGKRFELDWPWRPVAGADQTT